MRIESSAPRRILVVDDETPLADLVADYLRRDAFDVATVEDGLAALTAAHEFDPDVVVLDLGLPGMDGLEVCRRIRGFSDCYILMLTARSDEADKLVGLSAGADDYMTKPFSPRELVARVNVLLRRPRSDSAPPTVQSRDAADTHALTFGRLTIDPTAREVHVDGDAVNLTRTEFDVLAALAEQPRKVFTRAALLHAVWGDTWVGDEHLVDVHIGHLRRKLGDDAVDPVFIRTVRGVGYGMGEAR